jgi:hypothetical protein
VIANPHSFRALTRNSRRPFCLKGTSDDGMHENTVSNVDRSRSTSKGGDPGELEKGEEALSDAI